MVFILKLTHMVTDTARGLTSHRSLLPLFTLRSVYGGYYSPATNYYLIYKVPAVCLRVVEFTMVNAAPPTLIEVVRVLVPAGIW